MNKLLSRIKSLAADKVPKSHKTTHQWAAQWGGLSRANAFKIIQQAIAAGLMKRKDYRVIHKDGSCRPIPHYFEVKK